MVSACSSADVSTTGPSAAKCQVAANASPGTMPAGGGSGTLSVTTTRDCTWNATSNAGWLTFTSASSGQGTADVIYRSSANPDPSARQGMVTVNGTQVAVGQEGTPCRFTVTPADPSIDAAGGMLVLRVDTGSAACTWSASSQVAWIHTTSGSQSGTSATTLRIDANAGFARRGDVSVAGTDITVEQGAAPTQTPGPTPTPTPAPTPTPTPTPTPGPTPAPTCAYGLDVLQVLVAAAGGSGSVGVTTAAGCPWSASSDSGWLTVTPSSGTGAGSVSYIVAGSTLLASRTGQLTIGGQVVTVTQAAALPQPSACTYSISPTSATIGAPATTLDVAVTTQAGCAWKVKQVDKWLFAGAVSSGIGSGVANVDVERYKGSSQRTGTISVAEQTFSVTQTKADQ